MIAAWIVITLLVAVVVGIIAAGVSDDGGFGFLMGFGFVVNVSFWIAVIYVAAHFIGMYW